MVLEHLLPFGILEGLVTMLLLKYFLKREPDLVHAVSDLPKSE
jgi:ABC-type Co2+ transport system permease subunit